MHAYDKIFYHEYLESVRDEYKNSDWIKDHTRLRLGTLVWPTKTVTFTKSKGISEEAQERIIHSIYLHVVIQNGLNEKKITSTQ